MILQIVAARAARMVALAVLIVAVGMAWQPLSARAEDLDGNPRSLLPLVLSMPSPTSPSFESEPMAAGAVGVPYSYSVHVSGYPAPHLSLSYGPGDMSIGEDGVLHWTPANPGVHSVAIHASNGVIPDADQLFEIEVAPEPTAPAITSAPILSAAMGVLYAYPVSASGFPSPDITLDPGATPEGMTIDGNGLVQWTPAEEGVYSVTVRAANGVPPDAEQSFSIDVAFAAAPQIASTPVTSGTVDVRYLYQVNASGVPSPTFELGSGPDGMTVNGDGLLQWTPAEGGSYAVRVRASNGVPPDAEQQFTIDVPQQPTTPSFTSEPVTQATVGEPYAYSASAAGYPAPALDLLDYPAGMTMDGEGNIRWTPTTTGTEFVRIRASNNVGEVGQSFDIDVASGLPERIWDPRLDLRFANLVEADVESGELYWRLIEATWYDQYESGGRHNIFIDVLDEDGDRMVGVDVVVSWTHGYEVCTTEAKPGEDYATDFPMANVAPSYDAIPDMGLPPDPSKKLPADAVHGLGLGTISDPYHSIHTSYKLVWQLTRMP